MRLIEDYDGSKKAEAQEHTALVRFIEEMSSPEKRKTGIILDIAKRRLLDLETNMNY
jgi:hypothetical protein